MRAHLVPAFVLLAVGCAGDDGVDPLAFSVQFCAGTEPEWVAMQDGNGPWRQVMPSSESTWEFSFSGERGGIAMVHAADGFAHTDYILATRAELSRWYPQPQVLSCPPTKVVHGSVTGVGEGEVAMLSMGGGTSEVSEGLFTLEQVYGGPQYLVAVRAGVTATFDHTANSLVIRRGLDIPDGGSIAPAIDFNGSEAIQAATARVTVTGLDPGAGTELVYVGFASAVTGWAELGHFWVGPTSGPTTFGAVPAGELASDEYQSLTMSTSSATGSRLVHRYFRTVVDQELQFGPTLATPTVSSGASAPTTRPRIQLPVQAEYDQALYAIYGAGQRSAYLEITSAYLGHPSTWDVTVPDLSEASGWNNDWGLPPGAPFTWQVIGLGGAWPFLTEVGDGATARSAGLVSAVDLDMEGGLRTPSGWLRGRGLRLK